MKPHLYYTKYSRKFSTPFRFGHHELHERAGLYLKLKRDEQIFFSEVSPLPNHGRDSLDAVELDLQKHLEQILSSLSDESEPLPLLSNSLSWGISCLQKQRFSNVAPLRSTVSSNGIITLGLTMESFQNSWNQIVGTGYRTIKIKINDENWLSILERLENNLMKNSEVRIRLDANRSLSPQSWESICSQLPGFPLLMAQLDYIEEPTLGFFQEPQLEAPPCRVAIDESVHAENISAYLAKESGVDVFILKPSQWGTQENVISTLRMIRSAEKKCVLTSAIETELGRIQLLNFISSLEFDPHPSGLSVGGFFEGNLLPDRAQFPIPQTIPSQFLNYLGGLSWITLS